MSGGWNAFRTAAHWWAVLTASLTFVLLCSGGLVTSHGAGMAVPDWPNSFGYNMFLFPVSRWVGGIFYEHTHRLIASGVGLMTVILAIVLWRVDPRRWVKIFGVCAVLVVCLQGLLGGLRVVLTKDEIGVFHAMLAQSFFVAMAILAVVTARSFVEKRWADYEPHPTLRWWALAATLLIFLQLTIGAIMRHEHIGLSIPDFPLAYGRWLPDTSASAMEQINSQRLAAGEMKTSAVQIRIQMVHRATALVIAIAVLAFCWEARRAPRIVRFWSWIWVAMILTQIGLGAWTIWSNKAADVATAHMTMGALSLLVGALLTFRLFCGSRTQDFILPDATKRPLIERIA
jgi:heme a synthase